MTLLVEIPAPRSTTDVAAFPSGTTSRTDLRIGHQETLAAPRRPYSVPARVLFLSMDLLYGRAGTVSKFRVLEVVARLPYQAWELASYKKMNKVAGNPGALAALWERARGFRAQQDNEQWHLLIMNDLVAQSGAKQNWVMHRFLPRLICFGYWHFSWLLYVLKPTWSHRLNADFEDHAEHTYAEYVQDHPELDSTPWRPQTSAGYGSFATQGDLFRQICLDERSHKQESEQHL